MRFHDYADHYALAKKLGLGPQVGINSREELYQALVPSVAADPIGFRHVVFDRAWNEIGKPYYDVYPCIIPMLMKLKLAFRGDVITPPNGIEHLLLRLPTEPHALSMDGLTVRCAFMSFQGVSRAVGSLQRERGLAVGLDIGEENGGIPVYTIRIFPLDERTVEETIFALSAHPNTYKGIQVPEELILNTVRLALTICLIDDNAEFLEQQALNKDEAKLNAAKTDEERARLFDKAKRRGKWGFSLGKSIEVIPHYRRPHPCVVWTGKGRTIPKIVSRKGSFIHRNKLEQIPTGFEETNDEQ